MKSNFIFNTPQENALRALYILKASYPDRCSLERLLFLDYLSIYTKDSKLNSESLHPEYPMRAIELYERRDGLSKGLLIVAAKGIIEVEYENGISYSANGSTNWFLNGLNNEYSILLLKNTRLVVELFKDRTDLEIKRFIDENIDRWGNEFEKFFSLQEEVTK